MRALFLIFVVLGLIAAGIGLRLSGPNPLSEQQIAALPEGVAERGETVFWAGGCASCHAAPGAKGDAKLVLAGGVELHTPFGTFVAPNISPAKDGGLGQWSEADFANAMKRGLSPNGSHYYPAFPFTSYARMTDQDVTDLFAFIKTLPESQEASKPHKLGFPFNIRRGLGLWKWLYLDPAPVVPVQSGEDALIARGRYLVEGAGHCGACHTPRNPIGGPDKSRWLAGGPAPEGKGSIPNITSHADGMKNWSESEIVEVLTSGFTPDFDSLGGSMTDVVENMAKLSDEDRKAIAHYLKAIPAVPSPPKD